MGKWRRAEDYRLTCKRRKGTTAERWYLSNFFNFRFKPRKYHWWDQQHGFVIWCPPRHCPLTGFVCQQQILYRTSSIGQAVTPVWCDRAEWGLPRKTAKTAEGWGGTERYVEDEGEESEKENNCQWGQRLVLYASRPRSGIHDVGKRKGDDREVVVLSTSSYSGLGLCDAALHLLSIW